MSFMAVRTGLLLACPRSFYTHLLMPSWITLANFFTLIRLALVPFIIQAILSEHAGLAVALFCIAAATDVLDGAAARGMRHVTQTGAYFDPIADKALLSGVFLALAGAGTVP